MELNIIYASHILEGGEINIIKEHYHKKNDLDRLITTYNKFKSYYYLIRNDNDDKYYKSDKLDLIFDNDEIFYILIVDIPKFNLLDLKFEILCKLISIFAPKL